MDFEEIMKINDKASEEIFGIPYKECTLEDKKIINGVVHNYLNLIRMIDEAISLEHDPSIWDKSYGIDYRR